MSKIDILINIIEDMKKYVKGELELDCIDGVWIARDYREDLGGAFPIEIKNFNDKIIKVSEAEANGIDVRTCCNYCGVACVG